VDHLLIKYLQKLSSNKLKEEMKMEQLEREARVKASHQIEGSLEGPITGAISDLLVAEKNLDQTFQDIATFFVDSDLCANALLSEIDRHKAKFRKYSLSGKGMHAITILFTKTYTKLQRVAGMGKRFKAQHAEIKKVVKRKVRSLQKAAEQPQVLKLRPKFKNPFFMESLSELNKEFHLVKEGAKLSTAVTNAFPGTGLGWKPPADAKKKVRTSSGGDGGDDDDGDDDDQASSSSAKTANSGAGVAGVSVHVKKTAVAKNPFGNRRRMLVGSSPQSTKLQPHVQPLVARKGALVLSGALLGALVGCWGLLRLW
jgi:hypothetical protein